VSMADLRARLGAAGPRLRTRFRERPRELVVNAVLLTAIVLLAAGVLPMPYGLVLAAACLVLIHSEERASVARAKEPRTAPLGRSTEQD
jgi:hypothetical protein